MWRNLFDRNIAFVIIERTLIRMIFYNFRLGGIKMKKFLIGIFVIIVWIIGIRIEFFPSWSAIGLVIFVIFWVNWLTNEK